VQSCLDAESTSGPHTSSDNTTTEHPPATPEADQRQSGFQCGSVYRQQSGQQQTIREALPARAPARARVLAADVDGEEFREKAPGGPFPAPTISVGRCLELRTAISKFMIVAGFLMRRVVEGANCGTNSVSSSPAAGPGNERVRGHPGFTNQRGRTSGSLSMDHKLRRAAEEKLQYSPSLQEQFEQTTSEMRSQIRSLENAVKQLQNHLYRDSDISPAPLGVDLDEVAPPPWLRQAKLQSGNADVSIVQPGLKSKLLVRGHSRVAAEGSHWIHG
jgi:hypothetical protein